MQMNRSGNSSSGLIGSSHMHDRISCEMHAVVLEIKPDEIFEKKKNELFNILFISVNHQSHN